MIACSHLHAVMHTQANLMLCPSFGDTPHLQVVYEENRTTSADILNAIEDTGFEATLKSNEPLRSRELTVRCWSHAQHASRHPVLTSLVQGGGDTPIHRVYCLPLKTSR